MNVRPTAIPSELFGVGAEWAMSFSEASIISAINDS